MKLFGWAFLALVIGATAGSVLGADAPGDGKAPAGAPAPAPSPAPEAPKLDSGDTAWMLVSTGLVMLMVPGLALFYGGLVRSKNLLGTMMHSMVALAIIGLQWVLFGYAMAFGTSKGGWIGWSDAFMGLNGVLSNEPFPGTKIPIFVHCMYQGMFAIITPALISGAIAERIKFAPYCLFILLWAIFVYNPLAHWVWAVGPKATDPSAYEAAGWLGKMGALDFAGGTVVHVAAGVSGLAAILALRRRIGYPEHAIHPNSVVLSLFGAGLLWFGWFGFNGGSALGSNGLAGAALTATQVAAATAALSWMLVEWAHRGKPTGLGLATGLVAGLVAVTPAAGFVTPMSAIIIGAIAGVVCYIAVILKPFIKYDDSLDAFGVHGVGGALGAILTGVFASAALWQAGAGLTPADELGKLGPKGNDYFTQVMVQLTAVGIAAAYSFVVSFVLIKAIDIVFGFCLTPADEAVGLDRSQHGEVGFDFHFGSMDKVADHAPSAPRPASVPPNSKKRFTVVVDGAESGDLLRSWSEMCKAGATPSPELRAVYPNVTTVSGNRFRFRGGDPTTMSSQLQRLFESQLSGKKLRARVES